MKRILLSLLTAGAVGALAFGASQAFFSDTETSTGNVFESGSIDLKIDNTSYYNRVPQTRLTWGLKDLVNELFFDFHDLKPGDEGEDTVSLHVYNNDAWACVDIRISDNSDNGCTEPETEDGDPDCPTPFPSPTPAGGVGELANELEFIFWADDGDNVFEDDERPLAFGPASDVLGGVRWTIADSGSSIFPEEELSDEGALIGSHNYFIGKAWCYGSLTPSPVPAGQGVSPAENPGILCDGRLVGNASQTDVLMGDITFRAEQARNNEDFFCTLAP